MGKKQRTRQQKIIANLRRKLQKKEPPTIVYNQPAPSLKSETDLTLAFAYDPELIKKNLIKTFLVSLLILGIVAFIKVFFRL